MGDRTHLLTAWSLVSAEVTTSSLYRCERGGKGFGSHTVQLQRWSTASLPMRKWWLSWYEQRQTQVLTFVNCACFFNANSHTRHTTNRNDQAFSKENRIAWLFKCQVSFCGVDLQSCSFFQGSGQKDTLWNEDQTTSKSLAHPGDARDEKTWSVDYWKARFKSKLYQCKASVYNSSKKVSQDIPQGHRASKHLLGMAAKAWSPMWLKEVKDLGSSQQQCCPTCNTENVSVGSCRAEIYCEGSWWFQNLPDPSD